jgi:hypothetical protein
MTGVKIFFVRLFFRLWVATGLYYLWSRAWRRILESKYDSTKLTAYSSVVELEAVLSRMKWVSDPLKGAFDVISSPKKVENIYRMSTMKREPAEVGDCDEFAVYAGVSMKDMVSRKMVKVESIFLMTVVWLEKNGEFNGHNVCAFFDSTKKEWGHIGNYYDGRAQVRFKNLREIALEIVDGGTLIAWAYGDPSLRGRPVAYYS